MKRRTLVFSTVAALALGAAAFIANPSFAHNNNSHMRHGYGHGMMGNHEMMGNGNFDCAQYGQQKLDKELSVDDVRNIVERQLQRHGNDRLKIGKIEASGKNTIVAEIVTVDDSLVRKMEFDTKTGTHHPLK